MDERNFDLAIRNIGNSLGVRPLGVSEKIARAVSKNGHDRYLTDSLALLSFEIAMNAANEIEIFVPTLRDDDDDRVPIVVAFGFYVASKIGGRLGATVDPDRLFSLIFHSLTSLKGDYEKEIIWNQSIRNFEQLMQVEEGTQAWEWALRVVYLSMNFVFLRSEVTEFPRDFAQEFGSLLASLVDSRG